MRLAEAGKTESACVFSAACRLKERKVSAARSAGTMISPAYIHDKTLNSKHRIDGAAVNIGSYQGIGL